MHEFVVNQKASAPINLDQQPQFDSKCECILLFYSLLKTNDANNLQFRLL